MKVKEESENIGLKLNIHKSKIIASGPITSWQIDGWENNGNSYRLYCGGWGWGAAGKLKITPDDDCCHETKRHLLLGRRALSQLDSILKSIHNALPTKGHLVKIILFPVAMHGYERGL